MTAATRRPPASPCIGICTIDQQAQICTGCARTLNEIAGWGSAPEAVRARVWAALPERAAALGLRVRRLDWQGANLLDAVAERFIAGTGAFVVGTYGAVAEVSRGAHSAEARREGDTLTLTTTQAALYLHAAPFLTCFEIDRPEGAPLLALAVPATRLPSPGPTSLTALGPDDAALLPRDATGERFDLGLGRRAARFSIRASAPLAARIAPHLGKPWPAHLSHVALSLLQAGPVRVIESPCVRAEVDTPIPPPGTTAPDGPCTRLLPDLIAQGFETPPTLPLPRGYALAALYYPA